jgi:hypothetical protein
LLFSCQKCIVSLAIEFTFRYAKFVAQIAALVLQRRCSAAR